MLFTVIAAVSSATPIAAPPSPPPALLTTEIDPARLAAAQEVVDLAFPPAMRESMVSQVSASILTSAQRGVEGSPEFKAMMSDPRAVAIFDRYLAKRRAVITQLAQASVPTIFAAYSRAYARRFTPTQLAELKAFLQTETGQLYMSRTVSLMSDPDVVAAMQAIGAHAMRSTLGDDREAMVAGIRALPRGKR